MINISNRLRQWQATTLDALVQKHMGLPLAKRAEFFVSLFEEYFSPESSILDIGGRWGFYKEPLKSRGHHLTIIDVVKPRYQRAPVIVYDGVKIPFEDESFDCALLITVLHHIPDVISVIREARRVVRKKIIVVEDLYHHSLGRIWTEWRDRLYNFEYFGHPCNFKTAEQWSALFGKEGFRTQKLIQKYTWLAGMRILNGVFVFEKE